MASILADDGLSVRPIDPFANLNAAERRARSRLDQGPAAGVVINALNNSKVFTVDTNVIAAFFRLTLTEGANPNGFGGAMS